MKNRFRQVLKKYGWFPAWMLILITVSYLSSWGYLRIDLTQDKRYTLSETTHRILDSLDDKVFVTIYLDGDMPVSFRNMRRSIREMLDEYRIASGSNLEYDFVNPSAPDDPALRQELQDDLMRRGLKPTEVYERRKDGGTDQRLLFPGISMFYHGKNRIVNLLVNNPGLSAEQNLINSLQGLEYSFTHALKVLASKQVGKIAFVEGHGELDAYQTADITDELARFYEVYRGFIDTDSPNLDEYKVLIIAGPTQRFQENEKFVLDQYIMNGGKLIWLIDRLEVYHDSLSAGENTWALPRDLNLEDQLFRYGVRINADLISDLQAALIPVNTAVAGEQPRFIPAVWHYFPLLAPRSDHPITRNLNLVKAQYASSIDTVSSTDSRRTTNLLVSSRYTRLVNAPLRISLRQIDEEPRESDYSSSFEPVAVLLEGIFPSVFTHRMISDLPLAEGRSYRDQSLPTAMIVISDADILRNDLHWRGTIPEPLPLGYDRYMQQTFGNKDFIMNAVNYLTDDSGLMELRTREIRLRLLDRTRLNRQRTGWMVLNLAMPLLLLVITGLGVLLWKKHHYGKS